MPQCCANALPNVLVANMCVQGSCELAVRVVARSPGHVQIQYQEMSTFDAQDTPWTSAIRRPTHTQFNVRNTRAIGCPKHVRSQHPRHVQIRCPGHSTGQLQIRCPIHTRMSADGSMNERLKEGDRASHGMNASET